MGPEKSHKMPKNIGQTKSLFLTGAVVLILVIQCGAQFAAQGQARSPQEFDAYLEVLSKTSPSAVLAAAGDFERQWPQSELLAHVFELELEAHRSLGDAASAILAGEKALRSAPDNLVVLANLSEIIADSTDRPQQLALAKSYARRELERSSNMRVPKKISPGEWDEIRNRLDSISHAALGLVAYKNRELTTAIQEFEKAIKLAPAPEPTQYYRLGRLYRTQGNESGALEMLRRAAQSNDPAIRQLAERELEASKQKRP